MEFEIKEEIEKIEKFKRVPDGFIETKVFTVGEGSESRKFTDIESAKEYRETKLIMKKYYEIEHFQNEFKGETDLIFEDYFYWVRFHNQEEIEAFKKRHKYSTLVFQKDFELDKWYCLYTDYEDHGRETNYLIDEQYVVSRCSFLLDKLGYDVEKKSIKED